MIYGYLSICNFWMCFNLSIFFSFIFENKISSPCDPRLYLDYYLTRASALTSFQIKSISFIHPNITNHKFPSRGFTICSTSLLYLKTIDSILGPSPQKISPPNMLIITLYISAMQQRRGEWRIHCV